MALTDQPYIPFYVDDWMNNNKLKLCSPASHGIMISIMCLMHKESDHYGKLLLKEKYKQTNNQIHNFALQVARQSAFDLLDVEPALKELIDEKVLGLDGDFLFCERMIRDAELSLIRSKSGKLGGEKTQKSAKDFARAKTQANTVIGNVIDTESVNRIIKQIETKSEIIIPEAEKLVFIMVVVKMAEIFLSHNPEYFFDKETDYHACLQIGYKIAQLKKWSKDSILNGNMENCLSTWKEIVVFVKNDNWLNTRSLTDISTVKEFQRIIQKMSKPKTDETENNSRNSGKGKGVKNPEHQQGKYFDFDD